MGERFERVARGKQAGFSLSRARRTREWTDSRRQPHNIEPLAFERLCSTDQPRLRGTGGAMLGRELDQAGVTAAWAAQEKEWLWPIATPHWGRPVHTPR